MVAQERPVAPGDLLAGELAAAQGHNFLLTQKRRRAIDPVRPRGPVGQSGYATGPVARQPLGNGASGYQRSIAVPKATRVIPVVKTIDTFDFTARPSLNETLVRELLRGEYLERRENVLPVGNPGTGKTHLATALGFAACTSGKRVRFTSTTALVTLLLEMRENRSLQRFHKQLERLDLLILDELGYVPFAKAGAELLFDVVARAYERSSLIVTTNLPFENWTEVLGSERLTGAMLDRLTHRVHILEANGESYRLADAKRRLKRK
jgi:DNA replication protein DnaC